MSEQIVTGKKYKILADATNKVWHVISFISQAVDVVFTNGKNAQTTLGSITGISDSLTSTSSNVAASAASVKALNDKITELSSNLGTLRNEEFKRIDTTGWANNISFSVEKDHEYILTCILGDNETEFTSFTGMEIYSIVKHNNTDTCMVVCTIKATNNTITITSRITFVNLLKVV